MLRFTPAQSCLRRMYHWIKGQLSRVVLTRAWPPACGVAADPSVATPNCCHLPNQFGFCWCFSFNPRGAYEDMDQAGPQSASTLAFSREAWSDCNVWEPMVLKNQVSPCMRIAAKLWTCCFGKMQLLCLRVSSHQIVVNILVCLGRSAAHSLKMCRR